MLLFNKNYTVMLNLYYLVLLKVTTHYKRARYVKRTLVQWCEYGAYCPPVWPGFKLSPLLGHTVSLCVDGIKLASVKLRKLVATSVFTMTLSLLKIMQWKEASC